MKILRDFLRVFAVVLAIATLASFFFNFAWITASTNPSSEEVTSVTETVKVTGAELAFGSDKSADLGFDDGVATTFKSGWYFASFFLAIFTALFMILGMFKSKGWNGAALVTGLLNAILMLVFLCSRPLSYVDVGRLDASNVQLNRVFLLATICSIAAVVVCVAGILVRDYIEVKESNGTKLSIPAKIIKFLREYKSEIKKIVWPTGRTVLKNTIVVLIMCAIVLLLIWLVDLGLGELFKTVYNSSDASSIAASATSAISG